MIKSLLKETDYLKIIMLTRVLNPDWTDIMRKHDTYPEIMEMEELSSQSAARLLIAIGSHNLTR